MNFFKIFCAFKMECKTLDYQSHNSDTKLEIPRQLWQNQICFDSAWNALSRTWKWNFSRRIMISIILSKIQQEKLMLKIARLVRKWKRDVIVHIYRHSKCLPGCNARPLLKYLSRIEQLRGRGGGGGGGGGWWGWSRWWGVGGRACLIRVGIGCRAWNMCWSGLGLKRRLIFKICLILVYEKWFIGTMQELSEKISLVSHEIV